MKKMSLEESLQSIAISLSNVTEMGQYINVSSDAPETDLSGVEERLGDISVSLSDLSNDIVELEEIRSEITGLNNTNELILMQLIRIADIMEEQLKENKNKNNGKK